MKIAIFGADGRTGREVVTRAIEGGHEVVGFVRELPESQNPHVDYVVGDVLEPETIPEAVADVDAVVSTIGHVAGSDPRLQTKGITNIKAAMQAAGVSRLVSMTGAGVRDADDVNQGSGWFLTKALELVQPHRIADGREHAEVLRESNLDWTIVRCPKLTNGARTATYQSGYIKAGLFDTISRKNVADFILRCLENREYIHAAPIITG